MDYTPNGRAVEYSVSAFKRPIQIAPENINARIGLVLTHSMMGLGKEARGEAAKVLRINPKFSIDS